METVRKHLDYRLINNPITFQKLGIAVDMEIPTCQLNALGGFVLKSSAVSIHDQSEKVHVPLCLALQFDACSVKAWRVPCPGSGRCSALAHYLRVAEGTTEDDPLGGGPCDLVHATTRHAGKDREDLRRGARTPFSEHIGSRVSLITTSDVRV